MKMSRLNSSQGRRSVDGRRSASRNNNDLLNREEEYKRMNEELERRTATLVKEAEEVMRDQESYLAKPSLLDNINTDDFLDDSDGDEDKGFAKVAEKPPSRQAKVNNQSRPGSRTKKPPSRPNSRPGTRSKSNLAEDVAVPDEAFMTEFSLKNTIANIEGQIDDGTLPDDDDDDIIPTVATEMGVDAQIRFLKAKIRVMQEELDRLSTECNKKDETLNTMSSQVKETEEERARLLRTNTTQQTQIDKYKKIAEDSKNKSDSLENQLSGLRKELDSMKRSQKKQATDQSATEVRLNRAMEEVDRLKTQLSRAKSASKDTADSDKRKVEQLSAENKRLEKQKQELMTGFKKQLKLIDILKRQKMHIEAAKMLSFTEEEFVKALEWGN